jgi:hypothetical protein
MYILFNLQKNYLLYFLYMETEAQGVWVVADCPPGFNW